MPVREVVVAKKDEAEQRKMAVGRGRKQIAGRKNRVTSPVVVPGGNCKGGRERAESRAE